MRKDFYFHSSNFAAMNNLWQDRLGCPTFLIWHVINMDGYGRTQVKTLTQIQSHHMDLLATSKLKRGSVSLKAIKSDHDLYLLSLRKNRAH